MTSLHTTNWLLLGILVALVAHLILRVGDTPALAETFQLDGCITAAPNDRPASYVHVVCHNMAGGTDVISPYP